jgi:hypothetical protein
LTGIGLAITDHNCINGVLEAHRLDTGVPVVPGIEVSAEDGPHIRLYFCTIRDLTDFYEHHVEKNRRSAPYVAIKSTTQEILDARDGYSCVVSEAHPCGYFFLSRGVERCINGECLHQEIRTRFDALEVIWGGWRDPTTRMRWRSQKHHLGRTGGTDGHPLHELGGVLTCGYVDTVEGLLDAVLQRKSIVIGHEKTTIVHKAVMGTAIPYAPSPYAVSILQISAGGRTGSVFSADPIA